MSAGTRPIHYVCTHRDAELLIANQNDFWLEECGCRLEKGSCRHGQLEVCVWFRPKATGGTSRRPASRAEVLALLETARAKHLVTRPFRDDSRTKTEGLCFCCDDCCGYFVAPGEPCDPGRDIAQTDQAGCNDCGDCVAVCFFGAREMSGNSLQVADHRCLGCGLCVSVCPLDCVQMVARA